MSNHWYCNECGDRVHDDMNYCPRCQPERLFAEGVEKVDDRVDVLEKRVDDLERRLAALEGGGRGDVDS